MYLYIERCDCELVTAYPYNEFPTQKLLSDIRYMIEQLEDTVLPELDILEQAITNAQPHKIEQRNHDMFTKEQLEAIAEKLPQKVRRIEPDNEHLIMYFGKIFFEFYEQNHNRNVDHQYVEAIVIFFKEFNSKEVKWLEKHKITN